MVLSLGYRRPPYVSSSRTSLDSERSGAADSMSSGSSCPYGIPEALSFEKIISGGTCPPVTTREFMDFLRYIEHAPENLQFYLWYRDYCKRFAELPVSEQRLAPEWTAEQALAERTAAEKEKLPKKVTSSTAAVFRGTDFERTNKAALSDAAPNPFNTPPQTPSANDHDSNAPSTVGFSDDSTTLRSGTINHSKKAEAAFEGVGALQPFTIQPFREEISRIIATYIVEGGARSLNLSSKEKAVVMKALSFTTHPSAFRDVVATVEWSLRHQAHPNFIRWTICNGNKPRQTFARGLGVSGIVAGIVYGIVITLSSANRGWRALAFLGLFIGIATLFAAWKGMCVVGHQTGSLAPLETNKDRCCTACIIDISVPGSSLRTKTQRLPTMTSRRTHSTALALQTAGRTSLGSPNMKNVILSARFSTARFGFKNLFFARSKTPSLCKLSLLRSLSRQS
ncbi:hypothetical protein HRR86_002286 [Exophiala dermatitidis]|nr:hypothetical protein HRR82_003133 [Exophiala dermatitidis]KAJ4623896.1 hypothetical protein HRR85_000749 [Exophiala dermatitidis]KAJ4630741.1 hypothetical protein HRR86_002286 [Exophiala dermatitidis]KAJ4699199.1 hypothetical protein HRR87_000745 [Exophiala dermatitidis]KAJ8998512.1 hypothetical protein HRR94_006341 [Exophiala dermatitidis]